MSKIKKIFIVGGHGKNGNRHDSGAVALDGTTEREIVEAIGKRIYQLAKKNDIMRKFYFVGVAEKNTLLQKLNIVNKFSRAEKLNWQNSLLISLHCDWRGAREGVGAYHYSGDANSELFANVMADSVSSVGDRKKIWVRPDNESRFGRLGIIKDTKPLAILLELGSLRADDNEKDGLELLKSAEGQQKIAEAVFSAVLRCAGINTPEEDKKPVRASKVRMLTKKALDFTTAAKIVNKDNGNVENELILASSHLKIAIKKG